jgi:SAM-dependent methyltransferase
MKSTSTSEKKHASVSAEAVKPDMRDMPCILCGGGDDELLFKSNAGEDSFTAYAFSARRDSKLCRYNTWKCRKCGLVRSSPVLNEDALNSLYRQSLFIWENEADYASKTYADLLEKLCPGAKERGARVMEFGSGNGGFIKELLARAWRDPVGVEPSADCVKRADPAARLNMVCDTFHPGLFEPETFDIAVSFHVVDHLYDPLAVLAECRKTLKPGGKVLFVSHDVEAPSARILGRLSPIFDIEHIYLFSRATLSKLMEKAGFRAAAAGSLVNTYPLEYWMRMLPGARRLRGLMPGALLKKPLSVAAGNLYVIAEKEG